MTFSSPEEKRAFTRDLFARIASRYELSNVLISLGRVGAWRRYAAAQADLPGGGLVLDVAAGEGGLSRALTRQWRQARVVAVDFSPEMIRAGRDQADGRAIDWAEGDALWLPFPDDSFDAVVSGFMMRNVTDVETALAEQARVVKPGGRVICLEMSWPRNPLFRPLFHIYFAGVVPLLGWLLTRHIDAYRYLPRSVKLFLSPDELAATMERIGLRQVHYRRLALGTVTIHSGVLA